MDLIEQLMGVAYHPGHTWKLLRQRLRWRLQRPTRRAIERDERAIARWVAEDWPSDPAQRPASSGGYGVLGRVGASLLAVARRTWTPRGATPVIRHHFNWKRASMAAGLCYGSRGSRLTP